jgi:hypothetical protein
MIGGKTKDSELNSSMIKSPHSLSNAYRHDVKQIVFIVN